MVYEPTTIKEMYGNTQEINKLLECLKTSPYNTYIICGPNGIGKSTAIKLVLKELNYNYIFYDSVTYNNDTIIDKLVNLNHNNIICRMNNTKHTTTVLIVDNYDHITLSNEKNIIEGLLSFNEQKKKIPIILIISNNSYKLLEEFKKKFHIFYFKNLTPSEIYRYTEFLFKKNNIDIENKNVLYELIDFAQKDLRRLKLIIQDIITTMNQSCLTEEIVNNYIYNSSLKNKDFNLFESYKDMLLLSENYSKILTIYNNEKVLLPLTIQENCYKDINNKKISSFEKIKLNKDISKYISYGDVIETDIYQHQNWDLQDYHCFISCICPIQKLNYHKRYTSVDEIKYTVNFSSELNKTSLKNINRKNYTTLYNNFSDFDINDLLEISRILNQFFIDEEYTKIKEIVSEYSKIDIIKMIEILLKIDKCNTNNFVLSTKIKKNIIG